MAFTILRNIFIDGIDGSGLKEEFST